MTLTSAGSLGIGTNAPAYSLDIVGDLRVTNNAGNTIIANRTSNPGSVAWQHSGTETGQIQAVSGGGLHFYTGSSPSLRATLDNSGRLLVGTSTAVGDQLLVVQGYAGISTGGAEFGLRRGGNPSAADQGLGAITFQNNSGNSGARIEAISAGSWTSGSNHRSYLTFSTTADGASSPTERMRITSGGYVFIGTTTATYPNPGIGLYPSGYAELGNNAGTAGSGFFGFARSNVLIGSVTQTGTTGVAYNTSSDYRLKENVEPINGAVGRILRLKPSRFNFIADPDRTVDGFIAHEAQAVVPESVHGTKDEVDEAGKPIYQGIDQSKLVPLLTAALQEAIGRIETLEAEVAALKGA
jgi:hypothetical protein